MPIRINRVYTRKGDGGTTALVGGRRIPKDSQRIIAYGVIDELNSTLGIVRTLAEERAPEEVKSRLGDVLPALQNELFDLGSELATPPDGEYEGMWHASEGETKNLESVIDECQESLEPLDSFILPGGGIVGAFLHQARTICRRAEIEILRLSRDEENNPHIMGYVNRLSDLLFVLSRWVAQKSGEPEPLWERGLRLSPRKKKTRKA